jgi:hypothetical protein
MDKIILYGLALMSYTACHKAEEQTRKPPASLPPSGASVAIVRIEGKTIVPEETLATIMNPVVEFTTSRNDLVPCVLVHPMAADQWWVQNAPSLPDKDRAGQWVWSSMIYLGTKTLGLRERYEVMAIAEDSPSICSPGREIKVAEANQLLAEFPRSRKVVVFRPE